MKKSGNLKNDIVWLYQIKMNSNKLLSDILFQNLLDNIFIIYWLGDNIHSFITYKVLPVIKYFDIIDFFKKLVYFYGALNGLILLVLRCPIYPPNLPTYCRKVAIPGQCCPKLSCDIPGTNGSYIPPSEVQVEISLYCSL